MRARPLCCAGLSAAGGCLFLAKKSLDLADKVDSFHFGPGKPPDKAQGKADTLLEEHIFECDHGPEDFRGGSSQSAAGEKYKRQSRKSLGLSYKVRNCQRCHMLEACTQAARMHCARVRAPSRSFALRLVPGVPRVSV